MIVRMTPHPRRILRTVAVAILLAAAACRPSIRHTGDLDRIQEAGELRVVVRPGFLVSPVHSVGGVDQVGMLEQLGLTYASEQLPQLLSDSVKGNLAPHVFLDRLLGMEVERREERRIRTSLRLSGLPPGQTLGNFDWSF